MTSHVTLSATCSFLSFLNARCGSPLSLLCSGGAEHEDVVGHESWDRVRAELLYEGQDRHELQQWLLEGPHPFPLQERSPPSHRKHIQVIYFAGPAGGNQARVVFIS